MRLFFILGLVSSSIILHAQILSFDNVVNQAIGESTKLKIIQTDKTITQAKIEEVNSLYYPTISVGVYAQYSKALDDEANGYANIGDIYLSDQTQYETSGALRVNYDLYDFGVRANKKAMAKIDYQLVDYVMLEATQKLKFKLLEIYSRLLSTQQTLYHYQTIKSLQHQIYQQKKRLYNAGEIDKLTVANQAIDLVEADSQIKELQSQRKEQLQQLTFYTKVSYSEDSKITPLILQTQKKSLDYQESFTHQSFQLKQQQKEYELAELESQQYPVLNFFGKYNFYGSKECNLWCAFDDMQQRNYVVGLGVNYTLFEGFRSKATEKRLQAELLQLKLHDQEQEELYQQQQKENRLKTQSIATQIDTTQEGINKQQQKMVMLGRLATQQEIDSISVLQDKISVIQKQMTLEGQLIEQSSKLMEMEILKEK